MSKNNCYVTEDDNFRLIIYSKEQVLDFFGEDYLLEYGQCVPDDLIKKHFELKYNLDLVNQEIEDIVKKQKQGML